MPRSCEVIGCNNNVQKKSCKAKNITFHLFPLKNKSILRLWLVKLRRETFHPTEASCICSEHFKENDFTHQSDVNTRLLKPNAVPSKKLFSPNLKKPKNEPKNIGKKKSKVLDNAIETEVSAHDTFLSESSDSDMEELSKEDCANLLEVSMNEKFYMPNQFKKLSKSLLNTPRKRSKEIVRAMKEKLAAQIVDRSLKKQMLEAGIKSEKLKNDYYEAKTGKLSVTCNDVESQRHLVSEEDLKEFTSVCIQLSEEEEAAKIEEKVLQQHFYDAEKKALNSRRNFYRTKKSLMSLMEKDK